MKVEVGGRKFYFWLNSESVRHRDLTALYESEGFDLPDSFTDEELMKAISPKNVDILSATHQNSASSQYRGANELMRLPLLRDRSQTD